MCPAETHLTDPKSGTAVRNAAVSAIPQEQESISEAPVIIR